MENKRELRCLASAELRARGDSRTISGYGAVFDSLSEFIGYFGFRETIQYGAFSRVLRENPDVKCLIDHDPSLIVARTSAGSLRLDQDTHGLHFVAEVAPTSVGNDLLANIREGNVNQCSFGFTVAKDAWNSDRSLRQILEIGELRDVSPCTYPAYPQTQVNVRSVEGVKLDMGWYVGNRKITDTSHEPTSDELQRLKLKLALLSRL